MQPKTKRETKDNSEASRENKKEILRTAPEQWDQLAFTLIRQELAPKGFSEIKRGPWRGKVQSNIPFLPKSSVERCQKGAAQLVRAYRDKVRRELEGRMKDAENEQAKVEKSLNACRFWQFRLKRDYQEAYEHYLWKVGLLQILINKLDNIGIK